MSDDPLLVVKYRQRLRELLFWAGVPSNPGVTDDWVLDRVSDVFVGYMSRAGLSPMTLDNVPLGILGYLAKKRGWTVEEVKEKIAKTCQILHLNVESSIRFLADTYLDDKQKVICDGCRVTAPFEHRCHGERVQVAGESVAGSCQCVECFVGNKLL